MHVVKKEPIQSIRDESLHTDSIAEPYFKQKVEQGLQDLEEGKVISHDVVKRKVAQWKKSLGQ